MRRHYPSLDRSFDLVLVQQGLQFFPDTAAALREMYRVLDIGGRAATSTWTEVAHSPLFEVFSDRIQQHLGTPILHMPFSLTDPDTLKSLFGDAGFQTVEIERVTRRVRFPADGTFVDLSLASAAAAVPALQAMNEAERAALSEAIRTDMEAPSQAYMEGDALVSPMETHIVVARKAG